MKSALTLCGFWVIAGCSAQPENFAASDEDVRASIRDCKITTHNQYKGIHETAAESWLGWEWVGCKKALRCLGGQPTGFGIREGRGEDTSKLIVYFEEGGAVFDSITSYLTRIMGDDLFTIAEFDRLLASAPLRSATDLRAIFARKETWSNPFANWTQVYIPYCSGDVHAGTVKSPAKNWPYIHQGFNNVQTVLRWLATHAPFNQATDIVLTGASAGSYGVQTHYVPLRKLWERLRLPAKNFTLFFDSGVPFPPGVIDPCVLEHWRTLWGLNGTIGENECEQCRTTPDYLFANVDHLLARYPDTRAVLLSRVDDQVMRFFFNAEQCQSNLAKFGTQALRVALSNLHPPSLVGSIGAAYLLADLAARAVKNGGDPAVIFMPENVYCDSLVTLRETWRQKYPEQFYTYYMPSNADNGRRDYNSAIAKGHTWLSAGRFDQAWVRDMKLSEWLAGIVERNPTTPQHLADPYSCAAL